MPAMIRPKGLAKKIAFQVLGMPANMKSKPSKAQQYIEKQLLAQETSRVK